MKLYIILISLLLAACSTLPPAFEDTRIKDVSYVQVSEDVERYQNTLVRWGGVIIEVKNEESENLLQVLFYSLDHYGRPDVDKPSEGYFVIKSPEYLDPKQYNEGREMVAVGTIEGKTGSSAGAGRTGLPLIKASAIYLWPIAYRNNYYWHCPSCYFQQLFW